MPATQAGCPVDLDLGADNGLRYVRTVKQLAQEKKPAGKVPSKTFRVTYALTSTKSTSVRVQVREQVYGQTPRRGRQGRAGPAGHRGARGLGSRRGKASLTFTLNLRPA